MTLNIYKVQDKLSKGKDVTVPIQFKGNRKAKRWGNLFNRWDCQSGERAG